MYFKNKEGTLYQTQKNFRVGSLVRVLERFSCKHEVVALDGENAACEREDIGG
jgi:hypothetical protein